MHFWNEPVTKTTTKLTNICDTNNKLILRLKQFNFAVATNRRLVILAFNLLPQLPTMYYVLYCFKTDGILCILHNHLYHAIHPLSNVNQPF